MPKVKSYKKCESCGELYPRNRGFSKLQWEKSRFCGYKCGASLKIGVPLSPETRRKLSDALIGHPPTTKGMTWTLSDEKRKNIADATRRRLSDPAERLKMSKAQLARREKSHLWKGGVTPINKSIRAGAKYRLWRESVFRRDDWTCRHCSVRGGIINAHHIKPFAYHPELRFEIENGVTLCISCHRKTDTYAGKGRWPSEETRND